MLGLGLSIPAVAVRQAGGSSLAALIASLYGNGEQGAFFVPKPQVLGQQVLFQDATGTMPVTADGDPVGLMLDISKGLELGPELAPADITDLSAWTSTSNAVADGSSVLIGGVPGETGHLTALPLINPYHGSILLEIDYEVLSGRMRVQGRNGSDTSYLALNDYFYGSGVIRLTVRTTNGFGLRISAVDHGGNHGHVRINSVSVRELPGNHAIQEVSGSRPVYRTDGQYHWLEFDGVDDNVAADLGYNLVPGAYMAEAVKRGENTGANTLSRIDAASGSNDYFDLFAQGSERLQFRIRALSQEIELVTTAVSAVGSFTNNRPYVVEGSVEPIPGKVRAWIDGAVVGEADSNWPAELELGTAQLLLLGSSSPNRLFFGGCYMQLAPPQAERSALRQHLASLAGVTL